MRDVVILGPQASARDAFHACLAAILEIEDSEVPSTGDEEVPGPNLNRWLSGLGLGLVPVGQPAQFSWAGPWIATITDTGEGPSRPVVVYGIPPGVVADPSGAAPTADWTIESGWVLSALDIALARPAAHSIPGAAGTVEMIRVAPKAGAASVELESTRAIAGRGLEGDRHTVGAGTFPSGGPGSALTLIEAEVCESFSPALEPDEHRRNLITRGIDLNGLVGRDFTIGDVLCHGARLCEPCRVVDGYGKRPLLRALVHRGGLRADILSDGEFAVGGPVTAV